jgi:hypothetical protein
MAYIDPITGAYVADSLDALPPGYNQPKAGNEANVAKMRAALNNSWENDTPIPDFTPPKTDPFSLVKKAYEHMPGAGVAQGIMPSVLGMPQFLASLGYGIGNQVINPQTANFNKDTTQAMRAMQYTPPTQAGKDISNFLGKVGEATGPMPELWNTRVRFTPNDLAVVGRTATQDFRNFGSDYANAKAGVQREYPTMGSRAAQFTDVAGDLSRPIAEKAYDMYMNPRDAESFGINPVSNLSGLAPSSGPMYAVKPKGGNWPTNLGSTKPLAEQGELGRHLSEVQYNDPVAVFEQQLKKYFPRAVDNRNLLNDWEDFLHQYYQNNANGIKYSDLDGPAMMALKKEAADQFAENHNIAAADLDPTNKKLYTASQIEQTLPAYNSWVMGPYQKYITNQMGTGLATDPLLQAVNESEMPPHEIFSQQMPRDWEKETIEKRGFQRRGDFPDQMFGYKDTPEKIAALENSPIGKITATTPEGMDYENALDASLYPKGRASFRDKGGDFNFTDFPFAGKLDRNALVSDLLTEPEERTGFKEIRKQVFQDLISGKISPDKLSNVTPATVTRQMIKDKMAEFKEQQLSKQAAADWIPKRAAAMPTDMAFDDGSKMTIITPEMANADEAMTARDLGQITIDLNQCIGAGCHGTQDYPGHGPYLVPHTGKPPRGKVEYDKYNYLKRLKRGAIEVASLKDPEGVSQATIKLDLDKKSLTNRDREGIIYEWILQNHPDQIDEFGADINRRGQENAVRSAISKFDELRDVLASSPIANVKSISEMKGKDNGDIKEEYIPQMVQWLNSMGDKLTDVRDLNHLPNVGDLTRTYDTLGNIMDNHSHWDVNTVENFLDKVTDEKLLPRFFTADDFALKATELGIDLSEPPKRKGTQATQEAYEKLSQQLRLTYEDPYLQEYANGDPDVMQSVNNDIYYHPEQYGMGNFTHGTVMEAVQRLQDEGLHTPGRELENVAQQFEAEPNELDQVNAIRQQAYENLSETIIRLAPQAFEQLRDNLYIRQAFADVVRADPAMYGLTNYSPGLRERIIDRFAREGFAPEPEVEEQLPFDRPEFPDALTQNMSDYFEGRAHNLPEDMIEPYATETRILMGSQRPEARLPIGVHRVIVDALLDQDNRTNVIRRAISGLQMANAVNGIQLTLPQAENALNILIDWTERFPLNE